MMKIILQIQLIVLLAFCFCSSVQFQNKAAAKIPVIVITDVYHPAQDQGYNFDLLMAYTLPNSDLKAVILDCTALSVTCGC